MCKQGVRRVAGHVAQGIESQRGAAGCGAIDLFRVAARRPTAARADRRVSSQTFSPEFDATILAVDHVSMPSDIIVCFTGRGAVFAMAETRRD